MKQLMRFFLPFCAVSALLVAGDSIVSRPESYAVDPAQTKIEFTLGDVLHTVHGTFRLTRGTLQFDALSGKASGELVVDATSGESGSKARDKRMHSGILESDKYPRIVFRPDRVEGNLAAEGKSHVQLHGTFSIHGADHDRCGDVLPSDGRC